MQEWLQKKGVDAGKIEFLEIPFPQMADAAKEERDDWVAKFTGMKPEVAKEVTLPVFSTAFNVASLQANLDLAVRHKLVAKPYDVNAMIFRP